MFRRICFAVLISSTLAASASAQKPPTVSAALSPTSAAEGTRFRLTITRTGDLSAGSRVSWSLSGAVDAADFGAAALPSGISGFSPGQKTKIVNLQTVDDAEAEADETFAVTLAALSDAAIVNGVVSGVILNNDEVPPPPPTRAPQTLINPGHSAWWAIEDAFINHVYLTGDMHDTWVKNGLFDPATAKFVRGATSGNILIGTVRSGAAVRASGDYYKGKWILDWQGDGDFTITGGVGTTVRVSPNRIEEDLDPKTNGFRTAKINLTRVGAAGVSIIRFYQAPTRRVRRGTALRGSTERLGLSVEVGAIVLLQQPNPTHAERREPGLSGRPLLSSALFLLPLERQSPTGGLKLGVRSLSRCSIR